MPVKYPDSRAWGAVKKSADGVRWSAYPNGDKPQPPVSYNTSFAADENPISESGAWGKAANAWQSVETVSGHAQAAAYTEVSDDAYARLTDWVGNDYEVTATVRFAGANSGEVEILLRVEDTTTYVKAIEMLLNTSGSAFYIVRWNPKPLGDPDQYVELAGPFSAGFAGVDGMQIRARIQGRVINAWARPSAGDAWIHAVQDWNGGAALDNHLTGKPGMAFYVHAASDNRSYIGFNDYSVTAL